MLSRSKKYLKSQCTPSINGKITTTNLQNNIVYPSSHLNISHVQGTYSYDIKNSLPSSPDTAGEKRENPPNSFINDANSRLLNSRQLNLESPVTSKGQNVLSTQNQCKLAVGQAQENVTSNQQDNHSMITTSPAGIIPASPPSG